MIHIEKRNDVLIITDLETNRFRVVPNNSFYYLKFFLFEGNPITLKLTDNLSVSEVDAKIFKIRYGKYEHVTDISEYVLISQIIEKALNHETETAIEILTEYAETIISNTIQTDIIMYLLGNYSDRLKFLDTHIEVDKIFRVYYDAHRNHQEVCFLYYTLKGKHVLTEKWNHLCLVKHHNDKFKPQWFKINNHYHVLTKRGCEIISKILFLLESEKHKKDHVFWNQVKHLFTDHGQKLRELKQNQNIN